jgi:hypothetical protein
MNRHSSNKENSNLENKICGIMTSLINTQYNWSLILANLVIWSFGGAVFSYSANSHFNMDVAVNEYMKIFSIVAIVVGFFKSFEKSKFLIGVGIIGFLLSLFAIVMTKTLVMQGMLGELVLKPLCIFCFFILIKNMWNVGVSDDSEQNKIDKDNNI